MQIHCHTKGRSAPSGGGDIFISPSGPSMRQSGPFCPFFLSHFLLWSHLTFVCFLWQEHVSYSPKVFIGKSSVKQNLIQTLSYNMYLGRGMQWLAYFFFKWKYSDCHPMQTNMYPETDGILGYDYPLQLKWLLIIDYPLHDYDDYPLHDYDDYPLQWKWLPTTWL